ncbi:unnamed protein product [Rotaria magnacalcarata]|nr:unnamed protein product [Rotaria magnacalcarata]CAF2108502.1 unnamed protein product [Rotaria magnacalcarata]CAF2183571.1 unnamed protein product [Rotaria magnacalcarata]
MYRKIILSIHNVGLISVIHPQTKLRGTYETSLQLANLMVCSHVMNDCLQGQFYVITTNHVTLSHLASKNTTYTKLQTFIEKNIVRPSSSPLSVIINSSSSISEE